MTQELDALELGYRHPERRVSAATRDLALRVFRTLYAAARRHRPDTPGAIVLSAVGAAWLISLQVGALCEARMIVAACVGSLVATASLATGWASQPEQLERWTLRTIGAALVSALPVLIRV